jgi:hypothetical protein
MLFVLHLITSMKATAMVCHLHVSAVDEVNSLAGGIGEDRHIYDRTRVGEQCTQVLITIHIHDVISVQFLAKNDVSTARLHGAVLPAHRQRRRHQEVEEEGVKRCDVIRQLGGIQADTVRRPLCAGDVGHQ